ncbi:MAG: PD-(D/E)XK nuclease family protein, partial [Aestuariivirga sp.]
ARVVQIDGDDYILTAVADRIDILANSAVRLIDYKTGGLPGADEVKSGKSPQMTLESALLLEGAFAPLSPKAISEALYIQIGRNRSSMNVKAAGGTKIVDFNALAREHLANFKALLQIYRANEIAYLPRLMPKLEDEEMDYDHLSRFLEWQLSSPNPKGRA